MTPMVSTAEPRMPYLPALDGVRALAVAAVVLYHAGINWLPAGFLGVDVFFVVSGFLITALLVSEQERERRVDLRAFWLRRARRLLPALGLVLAATTVYAAIALGDQLLDQLREVFAAAAYATNWDLILRDVSYFETFERPSQLRHLWSLAVEEQFYIIWPVLFVVLARTCSRRAALAVVLILAAASLGWMMLLYEGGDPSRVYFGSDPRAFTILLGVALGLVWRPWRWSDLQRGGALALDFIGAAGLAAVAAIMLLAYWWEGWLYPWGLLGVSLGAAALIAAAVRRGSLLERALLAAPLRWLGLRSYGVYLWHWPVLLALRWEFDLSGWPLLALGAALSAAFAEASYRWLETPLRRREFWSRQRVPRHVWSPAAAALIAAAALGMVLLDTDAPPVLPEATAAAVAAAAAGEGREGISAAPQAGPVSAEPLLQAEPAAAAPPLVQFPRRPAAAVKNASPPPAAVQPEPPPDWPAPSHDPGEEPSPDHGEEHGHGERLPTFSYVIRDGDSPRSIADAFRTTVQSLIELNGEQITNVIHADDLILVPCPDGQPCMRISIVTRGAGCLAWQSELSVGRSCASGEILIGLPASFSTEPSPLAGPTIWHWRGESVSGERFELSAEEAVGRSDRLVVEFSPRPLAIGDSVMRHAIPLLSEVGLEVDAVGARSAVQSMKALALHLEQQSRKVVVFQGIGFGFVSANDFTRLIDSAADVEHLIVLTRQFPPTEPWIYLERATNEMLREEARKYPHVTLIDWNEISNDREGEFTTDGTHLTHSGLELYVELILEAIRNGPSGAAE